ncbi:hypothetical protein [Candidatus Rhabdochlamydia sp. T3358]|uniref:hypothetical protein n=1 Tax=Candidatus Rhabdochlamydia sp. T3358 TaxID=2099795 RepID=UPI0010B5654E|nr:hypothetical protein [Candidatus Rhabdochlamydia sp. T3358]VHO04130.1 hypothetical protein RHT_01216 [Candidatus Rhabdochlamydia sp. T3358]
MSSPSISHSSLNNNLGFPLQESGSFLGKVVTKVHTTTSYVISSISSVAQFILSSCISVGTLGRYTLDDLKDYFSTKVFLENKDTLAVPPEGDGIEETTVSEFAKDLIGAKSGLRRNGSKMSVNSTLFRKFHSKRNSKFESLYPNLKETVKLSTYEKTPEERLAEMEKSAINRGK